MSSTEEGNHNRVFKESFKDRLLKRDTMSKLEKGEEHNLTPGELDRIEKAIFEIARQQRGKLVPVKLPFADFWSRVGQLIIHLSLIHI